VTYWPQLFLGLCMNYSMLMAYVYVTKTFTFSIDVLVLYVGSVFWTLAYDTIYAHQDRKDDMKVGIKSSALSTLGGTKLFLGLCYSLFLVALSFSIVQKQRPKFITPRSFDGTFNVSSYFAVLPINLDGFPRP